MPDAGRWGHAGHNCRDRVVAAIYEAVLRPELYGDFLDVWSEYVLRELGGPEAADRISPAEDGHDAVMCGAELEEHFRRAFDIFERIGRDRKAPGIRRFVEEHPGYALLLRCDGSFIARSRDADQTGDLAALEAHLAAGSAQHLHELLASCADGDKRADAVVLSTDMPARYLIARLQPGAEAEGSERLVVIEPLEVIWSDRVKVLLERSFGLSPAELDLVRHLMAGRSLKQIAEQTSRSEHTVRNQSKSVLSKVGAPSQADLIRLVAVLCRPAGAGGGGRGWTGGRRHRLTDAAGRGFDVYEFGVSAGRPVLFLHGMLEALASFRLLAPELARRGLRVLAPVRAGYGESEPLRRPEQAIETALAQAETVFRQFAPSEAVVVVGHMAGAPHGFALAARHPDRVAAVLSVSGSLPFRSLAQFRSMAPRQRIVSYTARLAPMLLPAILRGAVAQIDGGLVSDFARALYIDGSPDDIVARRPEVFEALCDAYRFSVAQGHHGFLGDAYFAVRDWSAHVAATRCPVHFIHGAEDPAVAPPDVRRLCDEIPGAELTVLRDCGQLVLYQHPEVVLDRIAALRGATSPA